MKKKYYILLSLVIFLKSMIISAQIDSTCMQTLRGEVRDRVADSLLISAQVILLDADGNVVATQHVNDKAEFLFNIKCSSEYELKVTAEEYTAETKQFTTTSERDSGLKTTVLLDKGKIDFVFDPVSKVKNKEVHTIDSTPSIILADAVPKQPNHLFQKQKEEALKNEKFLSKTKINNRTSVDSEKIEVSGKPMTIEKAIELETIYFDLGSSYFNIIQRKRLDKVVKSMHKYPNMEIKCSANSDAQGTSKYNQWLSDRRAKRVKDYLVGKGINESRISINSFGDSHLINRCAKGVDCDDEEHAENRRVEFVIVKM